MNSPVYPRNSRGIRGNSRVTGKKVTRWAKNILPGNREIPTKCLSENFWSALLCAREARPLSVISFFFRLRVLSQTFMTRSLLTPRRYVPCVFSYPFFIWYLHIIHENIQHDIFFPGTGFPRDWHVAGLSRIGNHALMRDSQMIIMLQL